jgi:hypothetical protein
MFHDHYEELAPEFGYETRPETRNFRPTTPDGRLMIAVCAKVLTAIQERREKASTDTYKVTLVYENIESCGSRRLTSTYHLPATSYADAVDKGIERLGCNRNGKLFSVAAEQIFLDT